MIQIDWNFVVLGLVLGTIAGALFFAGLGLGLRLALRSGQPVRVLMLSATLRIAALLGVGWLVVSQGGPWAFAGFALSFLVVRTIATMVARADMPTGGAS